MPVYLLHGFRWPRPLIRIHIILQNLDDAAAEWLVAPGTTQTMLDNFKQLYPESMEHLTRLRFVEQYDTNDLSAEAASQPYAYVADIVQEVKLGIDVDEFRSKGIGNEQWVALQELRDMLAPEEKVGWYVVVCGDEERWVPSSTVSTPDFVVAPNGTARDSDTETESTYKKGRDGKASAHTEPRGLRKLLGSAGRLGRRKSRTFNESPDKRSPSTATSHQVDRNPPQLPAQLLPLNASTTDNSAAAAGARSFTPEPARTRPVDHGPSSVDGSISPLETSTPDTELSVSPLRRDPAVPSVKTPSSRDISPVKSPAPMGPLDRINIRRGSYGNLGTDSTRQAAMQAAAISQLQLRSQPQNNTRRSVNRHSLPTQPAKTPLSISKTASSRDDTERYEEIITLNLRSQMPLQSYQRPRVSPSMRSNSRSLSSGTSLDAVSENTNPAVYKPTNGDGLHDPNKFRPERAKPYFGQRVNQFDLIATSIEHAFDAMR